MTVHSPLKKFWQSMFPCLGFLFKLFEAVNYFRKKMDLWKDFLRNNEFSCGDVCSLVRIMFRIPANTGWVERAYSILENMCQKRRSQLAISTMSSLFFLAVLKLPVKESLEYKDKIKTLNKAS